MNGGQVLGLFIFLVLAGLFTAVAVAFASEPDSEATGHNPAAAAADTEVSPQTEHACTDLISVEPKPLTNRPIFRDISGLLENGMQTIDASPIGEWEAFFAGGKETILARRRAHNSDIVRQADALIVERTTVINHLHDMVAAAARVQRVEVDLQADSLESRLRLLKLQQEARELEALSDLRIETQRLEHEATQARAKAAIHPEPPRPEEDPLEAERSERRARVQAEQQRFDDFVADLTELCRNEWTNVERAPRIRSLMRIYEFAEEMLPAWARRILENGEGRSEE